MNRTNKNRFICVVFGRAGYGKSTLLMDLIPHLPKPCFILDSMDEYFDGLVFRRAKDLIGYLKSGKKNAEGVYILKTDSDTDSELFFQMFTLMKIRCTVVVDEVSKYCSPYAINTDLKRCINYGRHWEQNLVMAARRTAEVHRDVTAQADCIISFRQTEKRDLQKMQDQFNDVDQLTGLERGEFIAIGDLDKLPCAGQVRKRKMKAHAA